MGPMACACPSGGVGPEAEALPNFNMSRDAPSVQSFFQGQTQLSAALTSSSNCAAPDVCEARMRFVTVTSAIRRINWRTRYKRGFDAGALTLLLGPPLGGLAFGIIADVNHIVLVAKGQGPSTTFIETLLVSFL
jgi:hypothetical protein